MRQPGTEAGRANGWVVTSATTTKPYTNIQLQKLSLRRNPQNEMISADVIAWLVTALSDVDGLSQYSVEYGTALLMNLSLRTAGKAKCAAPTLASPNTF